MAQKAAEWSEFPRSWGRNFFVGAIEMFDGKSILITGEIGSFGKAFCASLPARQHPRTNQNDLPLGALRGLDTVNEE